MDAREVRLLPGSPFYDRQELHRKGYLASFEPDRFLFHYRALARLPQPNGAQPYGGWDSQFCRGHLMGHYLSAVSRMAAATGDPVFRDRANYVVAELAKCQDALKLDGYLAAFPMRAFDHLEGKPGGSGGIVVPYYTVHKFRQRPYRIATDTRVHSQATPPSMLETIALPPFVLHLRARVRRANAPVIVGRGSVCRSTTRTAGRTAPGSCWELILTALAIMIFTAAAHASVEAVKPLPAGAEFKLGDGLLRIDFVTDRIARVRATRNAAWSQTPSLMRVPVREQAGKVEVTNNASSPYVELRASKLTVRVDRVSGAGSYLDPDGHLLVAEDAARPRWLERTEVVKSVADPATAKKVQTVDGEREIADKYVQQKDRDAWKGGVRFHFADGEALYGLGFNETGDLNLRGKTKRLYQHNLRILIPTLFSTHGYGLLFDAYSAMNFKDGAEGGALDFDIIEDLDYYFIAGPTMDGAVAGYRQLTGAAAMLPRWAFGYVQSKERYKTQDELVAMVREFRQRQVPLDVIVQDWNYWINGQWGGDPDPKRYPDLAAMTRAIHEQNAHVMISIWPNPNPNSTLGKALAQGGFTLAGTRYFNAFDPKARAVYWNTIWQLLGQHGIDSWWCDSTEPEVADWKGKQRAANADEINVAGLARFAAERRGRASFISPRLTEKTTVPFCMRSSALMWSVAVANLLKPKRC